MVVIFSFGLGRTKHIVTQKREDRVLRGITFIRTGKRGSSFWSRKEERIHSSFNCLFFQPLIKCSLSFRHCVWAPW